MSTKHRVPRSAPRRLMSWWMGLVMILGGSILLFYLASRWHSFGYVLVVLVPLVIGFAIAYFAPGPVWLRVSIRRHRAGQCNRNPSDGGRRRAPLRLDSSDHGGFSPGSRVSGGDFCSASSGEKETRSRSPDSPFCALSGHSGTSLCGKPAACERRSGDHPNDTGPGNTG